MGQKIVTDIHQIDYLKNGKLQYLFATHNQLQLVDRNGKIVEGFPKKLPKGVEADQLALVDYDNTKVYRFLVSDKNGKLCYSARVEFLPLGEFSKNGDYMEADNEREVKPKLSVAGVYSFNESATRTMGQLGDYLLNSESANIQYYGADLMFKYNGFSIESEFYNRESLRWPDSPMFRLTLNYRFGKMDMNLFKRKNMKGESEGMQGIQM